MRPTMFLQAMVDFATHRALLVHMVGTSADKLYPKKLLHAYSNNMSYLLYALPPVSAGEDYSVSELEDNQSSLSEQVLPPNSYPTNAL
jgi:hypothetical protein